MSRYQRAEVTVPEFNRHMFMWTREATEQLRYKLEQQEWMLTHLQMIMKSLDHNDYQIMPQLHGQHYHKFMIRPTEYRNWITISFSTVTRYWSAKYATGHENVNRTHLTYNAAMRYVERFLGDLLITGGANHVGNQPLTISYRT